MGFIPSLGLILYLLMVALVTLYWFYKHIVKLSQRQLTLTKTALLKRPVQGLLTRQVVICKHQDPVSVILWIESGRIHDKVYDQEGQEMDQDPTGPGSKAGSGDTAWILFK